MSATAADFGDEGTLVLEQRFAIVPEWVIDADISDCAYRLYSVLLRYGQSSGQRMPGRARLAARLRKSSKDTVDRALKELVAAGAVAVEHRHDGRRGQLTNRYLLRSSPPGRKTAAPPGRTDAATPAADLRPNPGVPTQSKNPSPSPPPGPSAVRRAAPEPGEAEVLDVLRVCGGADLPGLAARCAQLRGDVGRPAARWAAPLLGQVLHQAVAVRGWPADLAVAALLAVTADPATNSPMRLAEAGPWWDAAEASSVRADNRRELEELERRLAEEDGRRLWLQQQARADLVAGGRPVTRLAVARRASELLEQAECTPC